MELDEGFFGRDGDIAFTSPTTPPPRKFLWWGLTVERPSDFLVLTCMAASPSLLIVCLAIPTKAWSSSWFRGVALKVCVSLVICGCFGYVIVRRSIVKRNLSTQAGASSRNADVALPSFVWHTVSEALLVIGSIAPLAAIDAFHPLGTSDMPSQFFIDFCSLSILLSRSGNIMVLPSTSDDERVRKPRACEMVFLWAHMFCTAFLLSSLGHLFDAAAKAEDWWLAPLHMLEVFAGIWVIGRSSCRCAHANGEIPDEAVAGRIPE
eukprot:CAMPEP_0176018216 /NCGR_PEP_ID=MMETSP0120_2-20121206/8764_1 /TAXON_ID=160619 /ORGANISM="Kryptoperidinium foliaceum, Strain CCMP 1326" /LENGTH=263 /DNA_ID=CAMNT_0017351261 /DNA_START=274 /DNA_END=1066 /DNA_ORIENTATION=+